MKKIYITIILLILFSNCFAYTANDLTWNGYLTINLDKENFKSGEEITGTIIITNEEYFPLIDNTIIIQTATGKYDYPSQISNENILNEKIINGTWNLSRNAKIIPFNLNAPNSPGDYHLSIYSWNQKAMLTGSDSILLNALIKNFSVIGEKINNEIIINRNQTHFGEIKQIGPVGFPVEENKNFPGTIIIENNSNVNSKKLKLELKICDWSCSINEPVLQKEIIIDEINSFSKKELNVELKAPSIPSAYEIKMILTEDTKIKSIYSNRVIVESGTSKIRKIMINGLEDEDFSITTIIAGSPDHFNNPDFFDFELELEVFNEGTKIKSDNKKFDSIQTSEILDANFYIGKKIFDKICLKITKNNKIFDEECFDVPLKELIEAENLRNPKLIEVTWNYNDLGKNLEIILTKSNNKINSRLQLIDFEQSIINELINQEKNFKQSFFVEHGKYTLIVTDFDSKRQQTIDLYLGITQEEILTGTEIIPLENLPCKGIICQQGFVCDSTPTVSKDGACCMTKCVSNEKTVYDFEQMIPLLFWIAILLFIGSIFVLHTSIKKARSRKK
ncbi:MAG: hypothetical protein PHX27_01385 [Candidatus ainarchaeum sp.]|nr:hypothetical protein [Candidatus ainarchaeum sp.]